MGEGSIADTACTVNLDVASEATCLEPGSFESEFGKCSLCPMGKFAVGKGVAFCSDCLEDTWTVTTDRSKCVTAGWGASCDTVGTFKRDAVTCAKCPLGTWSDKAGKDSTAEEGKRGEECTACTGAMTTDA